MVKQLVCTECGAKITLATNKEKCSYCGSLLDLSKAYDVRISEDVKQAACNAISFKNSLIAEVKGHRATITDMWDSLLANPNMSKEALFNFYKSYKTKIRFCIDAYKNASDDVKYELGDFICSQMESMINFRLKNKLNFVEELDEIDTLISKQEYDLKARGIFQIKRKLVIKKKIKKIKARRTILYYEYALQATEEITSAYNSQIEPLKSELNSTALTAFNRRKTLKEKIDSLETTKKKEIEAIGLKKATEAYNSVVRKFKIKHTPAIEEQPEERVLTPKAPKKVEIDYSSMSTIELIDALNASLSNLSKGITRSETETCKTIKAALELRANDLDSKDKLYFDSIIMNVNMIFSNEQPTIMQAMLQNVSSNITMQSANLKNNLNNKS